MTKDSETNLGLQLRAKRWSDKVWEIVMNQDIIEYWEEMYGAIEDIGKGKEQVGGVKEKKKEVRETVDPDDTSYQYGFPNPDE